MSSFVIGSGASRMAHGRRAGHPRLRHRVRLGLELLEDRIAPANLPVVTAVSPDSGAAGTVVTVSGMNFQGATAVFFGANEGTNPSFVGNDIQVTSPAGSGVVDVSVVTPAGTSLPNPPEDQFTYQSTPVPPPTVTGLNPASGPAAGGTFVTVTGTNFVNVSAVDFGATAGTNATVVNNNTISVFSPAGSGVVDVTVTTNTGTSPINQPADQFTYITTSAPTVSGLSPNNGPLAGGTTVTITGTNFSGATNVFFGTTAASFNDTSNTSITAVSPPGLSAGPVDVTVTTPGGTSATTPADVFTYLARPAVTGLSPTFGPAPGGTLVTITGTGFSQSDPVSVAFGSNQATGVTVVSTTTITALSPPGAGSVDVTVNTAGGTSATNPTDVFTYTTTTDGPRVTSDVRYGYHAQPTYFVIYFNMALDPASARLASNYSVVAWTIVGLIGQTFPVKSATYNAKSDSVTLAFAKRLVLRKSYTLTINGTTSAGIKNTFGVLLDGANTGRPGSNYVNTLSQYNLAGSARQRPVSAVLRAKVRSAIPGVKKAAFHHRDVY
jgi:IPT/TIG domain